MYVDTSESPRTPARSCSGPSPGGYPCVGCDIVIRWISPYSCCVFPAAVDGRGAWCVCRHAARVLTRPAPSSVRGIHPCSPCQVGSLCLLPCGVLLPAFGTRSSSPVPAAGDAAVRSAPRASRPWRRALPRVQIWGDAAGGRSL